MSSHMYVRLSLLKFALLCVEHVLIDALFLLLYRAFDNHSRCRVESVTVAMGLLLSKSQVFCQIIFINLVVCRSFILLVSFLFVLEVIKST